MTLQIGDWKGIRLHLVRVFILPLIVRIALCEITIADYFVVLTEKFV